MLNEDVRRRINEPDKQKECENMIDPQASSMAMTNSTDPIGVSHYKDNILSLGGHHGKLPSNAMKTPEATVGDCGVRLSLKPYL